MESVYKLQQELEFGGYMSCLVTVLIMNTNWRVYFADDHLHE